MHSKKSITIQDLEKNPELFDTPSLSLYLEDLVLKYFCEKIGQEYFKKAFLEHRDVFNVITSSYGNAEDFLLYFKNTGNFDKDFTYGVKLYFCIFRFCLEKGYTENSLEIKTLPSWLTSMNFTLSPKITSFAELSNLNDKSIITENNSFSRIISILGFENITKFDEETGYFMHYSEKEKLDDLMHNKKRDDLDVLKRLAEFIRENRLYKSIHNYEEFRTYMAMCLDHMRLSIYHCADYSFISGSFKEDFPFLFLSDQAPESLKRYFYHETYNLTFAYFEENPNYIHYFNHIHLNNVFKDRTIGLLNEETGQESTDLFMRYYIEKFGQTCFLELLSKYGTFLMSIETRIKLIINISDESKEAIDRQIRAFVYKALKESSNLKFSRLKDRNIAEFINEYPNIFIEEAEIPIKNLKSRANFYDKYYDRELSYNCLYEHPELIDFLKDKDLKIVFANKNYTADLGNLVTTDLLDYISNEDFLRLCHKYGEYFTAIDDELETEFMQKAPTFDELCQEIERIISVICHRGEFCYNPYKCPPFFKEQNPDLFLDENAPDALKRAFYFSQDGEFSFQYISNHKEYLPFLKGKSIVTALYRNSVTNKTESLFKFFEIFDSPTALKLIVAKPETILSMINADQVETIRIWYDATSRKFIPDHTVMQLFPTDEIDSFLANSRSWSNLQKLTRYVRTPENKNTLLRLAYVFGIFEGDKEGFNLLKNMLNGLPKHIDSKFNYKISLIDGIESHRIYMGSIQIPNTLEELNKVIYEYKDNTLQMYIILQTLKKELEREGFPIHENESIISQIYRLNNDFSYTLAIRPQDYPKSSELIRMLFERIAINFVINPDIAHDLFGSFTLKYDKNFRDFLLTNLETILNDDENGKQIGNIERQFKEIRTINSNRVLTWDLAVNYVLSHEYQNIELGNEAMAEIASIAGYSEQDFVILQQIYNYSKQRIFSSIPRIEAQKDDYTYEILRLDDPLALAIGTLTDCCQEIGNAAELCVEHSMVDQNGRIFVIKDKEGNLVSQSWVWRNNNVLCFDNIEIPKKAFVRASREGGYPSRNEFTDEIFDIYKQAAKDLIRLDENHYRKLLEEQQITKEQFELLRLRRVTVGIGYNDIAESIERNAKRIYNTTKSLPFDAPIPLSHELWTNDSMIQYLLEGEQESQTQSKQTLPSYHDAFPIYDKNTFNIKNLLLLQKLEILSFPDEYNYNSQINSIDTKDIFNKLARNYSCNPNNMKVLMTNTIAIIYEEQEMKIKVAAIYCQTKTEQETIDLTETVMLELHLALLEIGQEKAVDTSYLSKKEQEFFNKAMSIKEQEIKERMGLKTRL